MSGICEHTKFITKTGICNATQTRNIHILNQLGHFEPINILARQQKDILYQITVERNHIKSSFFVGENHNILLCDDENKVTKELMCGDYIPHSSRREHPMLDPIGIIHGLAYACGLLDKLTNTASILLEGNCLELIHLFDGPLWYKIRQTNLTKIYNLPAHFCTHFPRFNTYNETYLIGFLAGYFAVHGIVDEHGRGYIHSSNINVLNQIIAIAPVLGLYSSLHKGGHSTCQLYTLYLWRECLWPDFLILTNHKTLLANYRNTISKPKQPQWKITNIENSRQDGYVWNIDGQHSITLTNGITLSV